VNFVAIVAIAAIVVVIVLVVLVALDWLQSTKKWKHIVLSMAFVLAEERM
jgi:hypothetical protein